MTLLAHSIGGLVAKGAVDRLMQKTLSVGFDSIELHALGTPWGGFPGADLAHANPLGQLVSYLVGHPAWLDLGTHSEYLARLAQPMPPNGRLINYIGEEDTVAWPSSEAAEQRYARLLQHSAASFKLSDLDHNAYVQGQTDTLMHVLGRHTSPSQLAERTPESVQTHTSGASE